MKNPDCAFVHTLCLSSIKNSFRYQTNSKNVHATNVDVCNPNLVLSIILPTARSNTHPDVMTSEEGLWEGGPEESPRAVNLAGKHLATD
jgi:hypothetical protein